MNSKKFKLPNHASLFLEGKVFFEFGDYFMSLPELKRNHVGNGDPVLILPGFLVGDAGTFLMRNFLNEIGFNAHAWGQGVNKGPTRETLSGVDDTVRHLADKYGKPVSVVGWSLGGIYARETAKDHPEEIKMVITMGTPFRGLNAQTVIGYFEKAGINGIDALTPERVGQLHVSPPQPYTSIYSKTDQLINWETSIEDDYPNQTESVEIESTHFGLCHNPQSLEIVANRLVQDVNNWAPLKK